MMQGTYQNYEIVTQRKLYDYLDIPEDEEEKFREELCEEQLEFIEKEITTENVIIHFIEDPHYIYESYHYDSKANIDEYVQWLAVKDGLDLVRFSNGNLGYVAYYNGHQNAFEIIQTEMTEDEFDEVGEDMDWADYIDEENDDVPISERKAKDFYRDLCGIMYGDCNKTCQGVMSAGLIAQRMKISNGKANAFCNAMIKYGITERQGGMIVV